jgi:hypothetical protein
MSSFAPRSVLIRTSVVRHASLTTDPYQSDDRSDGSSCVACLTLDSKRLGATAVQDPPSKTGGLIMKKALILLVLAVGMNAIAQVAAIQPAIGDQAKLSLTLHCNKEASSCKAPDPGTYIMVRLPKNWGMYDCANVDLYPPTADPASAQKIGEYCLTEK